MLTIRIKLKRDFKTKKQGQIAHATRQQLKDLGLEAGKDYEVIGTPTTHLEPDLDKPATKKQDKTPQGKQGKTTK